jgi:O-antigen biosynthesis protein WbqP
MRVNVGDVPSHQAGRLPVTPVGRVLRRTNLDELPQLVNILRGEMSIVGPRPALESQEELIALRRANGALECLPGLTGLAQIRAYDGMPVSEKARHDGEYAERLGFLLDCGIVLRTVGYVLRSPPVY